MPSRTEQTIPPFPDDVPTADIYSVDFDLLCNGDQGDQDEARKMLDACRGYGFIYLSNTNIDSDFMFDLANETFLLPLEEKMKYEMGETGRYFGYKMSGSQYVDKKGTPDKSEFYNISKDDILAIGPYKAEPLNHPETIKRRRSELEQFMTLAHDVVDVILRTLGERLGLDPDLLPSLHKIDRTGGDQARVTHALPVSADTITLGEHTGAIINLRDALVKLVGGRLYSGLHRVMGPPGGQAQSPRHSVVYFSRPNGDVKLKSLLDEDDDQQEEVLTADEWIARRARLRRTANYKDEQTFHASRGTEHNNSRDKPLLNRPAATVEVI